MMGAACVAGVTFSTSPANHQNDVHRRPLQPCSWALQKASTDQTVTPFEPGLRMGEVCAHRLRSIRRTSR